MLRNIGLAIFITPALCVAQNSAPMLDGPGKTIIQKACVGCHSLKVVTSKRATHDEWAALVDQMVSKGAEVPDEDVDKVVQYLADHYGPPKDGNAAPPEPAKPNTVRETRTDTQQVKRVLGLSYRGFEAAGLAARLD
jgi:hypothetical protein